MRDPGADGPALFRDPRSCGRAMFGRSVPTDPLNHFKVRSNRSLERPAQSRQGCEAGWLCRTRGELRLSAVSCSQQQTHVAGFQIIRNQQGFVDGMNSMLPATQRDCRVPVGRQPVCVQSTVTR